VEGVETVQEKKEIEVSFSPYANFMYALKSPEVRRQYPKLFKIFLDTIKLGLDKDIEERAYLLFQQSISNKKIGIESDNNHSLIFSTLICYSPIIRSSNIFFQHYYI
jgi:hypothetical protein